MPNIQRWHVSGSRFCSRERRKCCIPGHSSLAVCALRVLFEKYEYSRPVGLTKVPYFQYIAGASSSSWQPGSNKILITGGVMVLPHLTANPIIRMTSRRIKNRQLECTTSVWGNAFMSNEDLTMSTHFSFKSNSIVFSCCHINRWLFHPFSERH